MRDFSLVQTGTAESQDAGSSQTISTAKRRSILRYLLLPDCNIKEKWEVRWFFTCFSGFRFHVVASKGNLDCLNTILIHGVDITATDAAGGWPQVSKGSQLGGCFGVFE